MESLKLDEKFPEPVGVKPGTWVLLYVIAYAQFMCLHFHLVLIVSCTKYVVELSTCTR